MRGLAWLALLLSAACGSSLDRSLDGKRCTADHSCSPGYVCSPELLCVRPSQLRGASLQPADAGVDASTREDAATIVEDAATTLEDAATTPKDAAAPNDAGPPAPSTPPSCPAGMTQCDGSCVDLDRDIRHCGSCGHTCATGAAVGGDVLCRAGSCETSCEAGLTKCDDACVDIHEDVKHCGACGNACPAGEHAFTACDQGSCQMACATGFTLCTGECVDDALILQASISGLGKLSTCDAFELLRSLSQVIVCQPNQTLCDDACVDLQSDAAHCGSCATSCSEPEACRGARCVTP